MAKNSQQEQPKQEPETQTIGNGPSVEIDESGLILDTAIEVAGDYAGKAFLYTSAAALITAAARYLLKK